jgi:glucose-1-phosphate adenylyltransferase
MHANDAVASRTTTFVLGANSDKHLAPLTSGRVKPLVPFGGLFRIVDFTLSNCVNSGIERAYLLTGRHTNSMRRYVESSSWRTQLHCLPPLFTDGYQGTGDSLYQNLNLVCGDAADCVLVLPADQICKMDYRKLLRFHHSHGGDATIATAHYPLQFANRGYLELAGDGRVSRLQQTPGQRSIASLASTSVLANMGVYVLTATALRRALLRDAGMTRSTHDLVKDILPYVIESNRTFAYDFTANSSDLGAYLFDRLLLPEPHGTSGDELSV